MGFVTVLPRASRDQLVATARGLVSQSWDLANNNTATTLSTQTIRGSLLGLWGGDVVTNIVVCVGTASGGTAPTLVRLGLLDKTGKVLATTADVHATAITVGFQAFALTAAYTAPTTDAYYAAMVINGVWGTTQPQFIIGNSGVTAPGKALGSNPRRAFDQTSQTDLPAVNSSVTPADAGQQLWFGVS